MGYTADWYAQSIELGRMERRASGQSSFNRMLFLTLILALVTEYRTRKLWSYPCIVLIILYHGPSMTGQFDELGILLFAIGTVHC